MVDSFQEVLPKSAFPIEIGRNMTFDIFMLKLSIADLDEREPEEGKACDICYQTFSDDKESVIQYLTAYSATDVYGSGWLVKLPCKHSYCLRCLCQWLQGPGTTCPTCRFKLIASDIVDSDRLEEVFEGGS